MHRHSRVVVDPKDVLALQVAARFDVEATGRGGAFVGPHQRQRPLADARHGIVAARQAEQDRRGAQHAPPWVHHPQPSLALVDHQERLAAVIGRGDNGAHQRACSAGQRGCCEVANGCRSGAGTRHGNRGQDNENAGGEDEESTEHRRVESAGWPRHGSSSLPTRCRQTSALIGIAPALPRFGLFSRCARAVPREHSAAVPPAWGPHTVARREPLMGRRGRHRPAARAWRHRIEARRGPTEKVP